MLSYLSVRACRWAFEEVDICQHEKKHINYDAAILVCAINSACSLVHYCMSKNRHVTRTMHLDAWPQETDTANELSVSRNGDSPRFRWRVKIHRRPQTAPDQSQWSVGWLVGRAE